MMPSAPFSGVHHQESPDCVRCSLALANTNSKCQRDSNSKQKTRGSTVIRLPWTDRHGCTAHYTGQVNKLGQPHGIGVLRYSDGRAHSSSWCNGMSLQNEPSSKPDKQKGLDRIKDGCRFDPLPFESDAFSYQPTQQVCKSKHKLKLGDFGTTQDMHIETDREEAYAKAASLPIHSFAFVRRSNGEWIYAIVANRPVENGPEASIRFVVDQEGNTKTLKCKYWSTCIRLVKIDASQGVKNALKTKEDPRMSSVEASDTSTSEGKGSAKVQNPVERHTQTNNKSASLKPPRRCVSFHDLAAADKSKTRYARSSSFIHNAPSQSPDVIFEDKEKHFVSHTNDKSASLKPPRRCVSFHDLAAADKSKARYVRLTSAPSRSPEIISEDKEKDIVRSASFHRSYAKMSSGNTSTFDEEFAKMNSFHRALRRLSDDISLRTNDSGSCKEDVAL